jgi:ABC-type multidrug transport system fused ATPase/permease subunit
VCACTTLHSQPTPLAECAPLSICVAGGYRQYWFLPTLLIAAAFLLALLLNRRRRAREAAAAKALANAGTAAPSAAPRVDSMSLITEPLSLTFRDVTVAVDDPAATGGRREVLHGVSGEFASGKVCDGSARAAHRLTRSPWPQLVALMGPSGAGKTTLLNALAARVPLVRCARPAAVHNR